MLAERSTITIRLRPAMPVVRKNGRASASASSASSSSWSSSSSS